jgi:uncharacterized protein YukE
MGQEYGALSHAAALVREARGDLDRLDQRVALHLATAESSWSGRGAAALQTLGRAWSERQRTIVGALDLFEHSLRSTERDNTLTDDEQSSAFARTQGRLG